MDDAALVEAARSGDSTAWAAIYDRYADKLHDHCHRILRDRDEAADALHDAFLAGARNLHQLRDSTRLRPWLYSICRHTSLRRLKARGRVELTDAPDEMSAPDDGLDRGVRAQELSELVWAAAAGLSGRDQALLDLNLRQGLEGQDLADAMGTSLSNSYVMLSRMRDQVERSLGALLIARMGRDDCPTLDGLLKGWDGKFSPILRKRVARHVDDCEICSEKRKSVVSPLALLAAAPLVPAPALLKTRVISSIRNVEVMDGPRVPFTKEGFAALGAEGGDRRPKAAWLAVAVAVLLVIAGIFLLDDDGSTSLTTAAGGSTSLQERSRVTTSTASDGSSTTLAGGAEDEGTADTTVDAGDDDGGTDGAPAAPTDGGGATTQPPAPTTTAPKADTTPPTIGRVNVIGPSCVSPNGSSFIVQATASGATSVRLQGGSGAGAMSDDTNDGTYARSFNASGALPEMTVVATDAAGNTATKSVGARPACATTTSSTTLPRPG